MVLAAPVSTMFLPALTKLTSTRVSYIYEDLRSKSQQGAVDLNIACSAAY